MEKDSDVTLKDHLAAVKKDFATACQRLTYYEAQLGRRIDLHNRRFLHLG